MKKEPRTPLKHEQLCRDKAVEFYNNTLIGNWFEERSHYTKQKYKHNSLYNVDYIRRNPKETLNILEIANAAAEDVNISIAPTKISDEFPSYYENYSTLYDLSMQYFPHWYKGSIDRKIRFTLLQWEPTNEYLNSYGNLTKRHNLHTEEWNCDGLDPRKTTHSIYHQSFAKPDEDSYKFIRWTRTTPVKRTSQHVTDMVYKPLPNNHPRVLEANCNPIIWECKFEEERQPKHLCMCNEKRSFIKF